MGDWQSTLQRLKDQSPKEETKMIVFYKNGHIDPDLIHKYAERKAEQFFKQRLTSAQIRRFYGEVLTIEEKLKSTKNFDLVYPQILMLKSKAAYAANPKSRKIPDVFKEWIYSMVDSIKNEKDFKAFKMIFEAVVGYFYGKGAK